MPKKCNEQHNEKLDGRTLAFLINDILDISISDLCRYVNDNYKSIDCDIIRKNYVYFAMNGNDIHEMLSSYVINKIKSIEEYKNDEEYDYDSIVKNNLDIFFDTTESDNDTIIVELSKYV
jgi:hypothetical protein